MRCLHEITRKDSSDDDMCIAIICQHFRFSKNPMQMLTRMCLNIEIKAENPEWLSLNERKNDGERTNASVTWCTNEWKIDREKIVNFKKEVQHFMLSRLVTWVIELMGTSMRSISSSQSWTGRQWTGNSIMRSSSLSCGVFGSVNVLRYLCV